MEYDSLITRHNARYERLAKGVSQEDKTQLVVVGCYWDQVAHSASLNGFYCGYRAALAIIDEVVPVTEGSFNITDKLLSMEHYLGYIRSYAEIERHQA